MKDIAIYGAGGFGREVACLLKRINEQVPTWNLLGFFDDGKEHGYVTEYGKVLGGIEQLNSFSYPLSVIIAIGSPKTVERIVDKIKNPMIDFPNIFSPDTIFLDKDNISFGKGNLVCAGCLFSCNVQVGNFNTFNGFITIGHDAVIGNFNSLMPAVRISGEVHVGNCNFFGVSSVILQQIRIGNETVIGANSTILRKTKDGNTYVGNPASIVKY
ncbi:MULTISPECIES: NeuD/PglB/VioB family sugar acetyltransferase [Bacteroides]|uniref:NeuD/PglB/VioB family sugar acetyltransferase n=1 Tax=Bacteroides TaxID=816 RepID=UPI000E437A5A|nr:MULTISPECIES: NeuD/PglB/VioB family sugar acetyltransferase [Bacteroides]RGM44059.1 serine acetyltransferase [Bacteroides sp. OM08-11]